ncbi:MAG: OmpH family outer membrane protein [Bdellovibrionota bacterium]
MKLKWLNVLMLTVLVAGIFLVIPLSVEGSEAKYGVVNMQKVILSVTEGKTARSTLEKEIKAKEAELLKKKQELDKLNADWKNQAPLLSEEARMNKQKSFQEKFLALRSEEMKFQQEIKQKEATATQKIAIKVAGMVEKMAAKRKLEAVFETNSAGLLYLKDPIDLTDTVIAEYDKVNTTAKKK